jgi:hypothetical protein
LPLKVHAAFDLLELGLMGQPCRSSSRRVLEQTRGRVSSLDQAKPGELLAPGGKFLFTDAGVITASLSNDEIALRAFHGYTQFVPPGFNERMPFHFPENRQPVPKVQNRVE